MWCGVLQIHRLSALRCSRESNWVLPHRKLVRLSLCLPMNLDIFALTSRESLISEMADMELFAWDEPSDKHCVSTIILNSTYMLNKSLAPTPSIASSLKYNSIRNHSPIPSRCWLSVRSEIGMWWSRPL